MRHRTFEEDMEEREQSDWAVRELDSVNRRRRKGRSSQTRKKINRKRDK